MAIPATEQWRAILDHFPWVDPPVAVEAFGNGHINDTLKTVDARGESHYVLQRINHHIFKDVDLLQRNIDIVTSHIRKKLIAAGETDIDRKVLTFLPARNGKSYYFDGESYWRVSRFIPGSRTMEAITPTSSYEAGKAFGRFQAMLSDLPEGALGETIPHFHNMPFRLRQFQDARVANSAGRLKEVRDLVAEIDARATAMCLQEDLHRDGRLKKRINHCDTKVNNILFDEDGTVLCVIDLDTVMPGFVLSDIGDFIRTACNTGAEDEADLTRIHVDLTRFEAYTRGYMETSASFLTPLEISLLPYGGRLLTYMQTVRFLTDYLNGDVYYKIHFPRHNLQRARAQFRLLEELEAHASEMDAFMDQFLNLARAKKGLA
jgi:Ser/Thr protein kinase RdoA (MazF antagonist)